MTPQNHTTRLAVPNGSFRFPPGASAVVWEIIVTYGFPEIFAFKETPSVFSIFSR